MRPGWLAARRLPVRRLAGSDRAAGSSLGGTDGSDLPGERLLRPQRSPHRARGLAPRGRRDDAARYEGVARDVGSSTWARWREHVVSNQTGCAVAVQFGLVPDDERQVVGDTLAALVRATDGRVATGFLGTPLVLPALAATGHLEEAYLALLCREAPSWLYQVTRGATTVWERWDAIRPDGSIHPGVMAPLPGAEDGGEGGHMLSFNHYAYGAVVDWVYRTVAGLAPDITSPGYRRVIVAPRPDESITFCKASLDAPQGPVSIAGESKASRSRRSSILPFGTTGLLDPPSGPSSVVVVDGQRLEGDAGACGGAGAGPAHGRGDPTRSWSRRWRRDDRRHDPRPITRRGVLQRRTTTRSRSATSPR